jgi:2-amino-4-hydroxy-6-hydroxymethyldihydropteridine diphosphokinase
MGVYIGLGSNLGNREANLRMALRGLARLARVEAVSSLYETQAEGPPQPAYYNAACAIATGLEPPGLLRFLKSLEHEIGRRPAPGQNAPRVIDLDVLLWDDLVLESPGLVIPHPRLAGRPFVLTPLAEIAPEAVHPVLGQSIAQLAEKAGSEGLRLVAGRGWDGGAGVVPHIRL